MILIKDVTFLDSKVRNILIEDKKILKIGEVSDKSDVVINGRGKLALPPLINTHTHLAMTLFRGFGDDMKLEKWLEDKIWPLETKLTKKHVYWGSLLGCLELLKNGVTLFFDMYFFMKEVGKAVLKSGIKGVLAPTVFDFETPETKNPLKTAENFIREFLGSERVIPSIGPHACYTCSQENLLKSKEISEKYKIPMQIHVSETRKEVYDFEKKMGERPVKYLEKIGFLQKNLIAAHCVFVTKEEIKILAKNNVTVSHNPVSNLKLASGGLMPLPEMLEYGVRVTLGTDGAASNNILDIFQEMKVAAILHKNSRWRADILPAKTIFSLATENSYKALDLNFGLKEGCVADLVLVDLKKPHLTPPHNLLSHVVYAVRGSDVSHVVCNGKLILDNSKVLTLDEEKVIEKTNKIALDLVSQ